MSSNNAVLTEKVLVIDTNIDYCKYIQAILKENNILVYIATSHDDAIDIAKDKIPDCILIDYMLPYGGAINFTEKIKEDNLLGNTPIIYLTANDSKKAYLNALDSGGDDLILKSTDKDILVARIRAFLRQKRVLETNASYIKLLKKDIEYASKIQKTILSHGNITIPRNDISIFHYAPNEVSGDISSVKHLNDDWYAIILADVSGHGVAASMLTILIKSFFDSNAIVNDEKLMPDSFITKLNEFFISENFDRSLFATIFYALYNNKTGEFIFSSGGASEPIFLSHKTGEANFIDVKGPLLGISEDSSYSNQTIKLNRNDMIFIFTDGAYEVFNENNEIFGEDRLKDLFSSLTKNNVVSISNDIIENLKTYSKNALEDDISMLILRRTE